MDAVVNNDMRAQVAPQPQAGALDSRALLEKARETLGDAYDAGASATSLLPLINEIDAAISQPQAGEPDWWVGYGARKPAEATRMRRVAEIWRDQGLTVEPLYTSPQPANPVQVTDANVDTALDIYEGEDKTYGIGELDHKRRLMRRALTAAIGAGGQAVGNEWTCPKCGAQADERFDCCEVHEQMQGVGERVAAWLWEHPEHALRVELHPLGDDDIDNDWRETRLYTHPAPSGQAVAEADQVLDAVLSCSHSIDAQSVVLKTAYDKPGNALKQLHDRITAALSQPHPADERVVEALRFYARPGTWEDDRAPDPAGTPIPGTMPADIDRGDIARAALAAKEGRKDV